MIFARVGSRIEQARAGGQHEMRLPIAEASAAVEMHPQTLRKYERAGLLHPARRSGGSRHYSRDDLARLALIKQLAEARHINVAGISLVLALHDEIARLVTDQCAPPNVRQELERLLELIADGRDGPAG